MRVLAFVVACTLIAQPADLDRKLWIQNLLVRMEKARDEGATRVRAAEALGREINPVTMTAAEFRKRRAKDPFLRDVLGKEKLFVKGDANELGRLG